MNKLCEFCGKEFISSIKEKRFCNVLCQRKHYNRRPEIRERYRVRIREYRKMNPEWREKHRILQAKYRKRDNSYQKEYFQRPKVKSMLRERAKKLRKTNPEFAIASRLRRALRHALTKYSDTGKIKSSRKYGIDWKEIIEHLRPFPKDMSDYEIDHIRPLCTFNLNDEKEIKIAFSPKNLQWLTKRENRSKGGKQDNSLTGSSNNNS